MKHALLVMPEPPPINGVMAIRYGKLLAPLHELGWALHVLGPDPHAASPFPPTQFDPGERGHYLRDLPLSLRSSVERNRRAGLRRIAWSAIRGSCLIAERAGFCDPRAVVETRLLRLGETLDHQRFDLVMAIYPDRSTLDLGERLASRWGCPLILSFDDPMGARDIDGFTPAAPRRQEALIRAASGLAFASHLTAERYSACFDCRHARLAVLPDSYVEPVPLPASPENDDFITMLHFGSLASWRPVHGLVEAIAAHNRENRPPVRLRCVGFVDDENARAMHAGLGPLVSIEAPRPYADLPQLVKKAHLLLVAVGPRHADNVPSKLYEYLAFRRPQWVASPANGAAAAVLATLGVGVHSDIDDAVAMRRGLGELISRRHAILAADPWSGAPVHALQSARVARGWAALFDAVVSGARKEAG